MGIFQSPVSKIAERAGVADGTVYLYFKNKDDLLAVGDRPDLMQQFYDGDGAGVFERVTDPRWIELEVIGRLHLEDMA